MKRNLVKLIVGLFLLLIGTIGLFHAKFANLYLSSSSDSYALRAIDGDVSDDYNSGDFDLSNVSSISAMSILTTPHTDSQPLGGIAIPEIGINLAIFSGLGDDVLSVGAGTVKQGHKMGEQNFVLASHSLFYGWGAENLLFTPLKRSQLGQYIYIHDGTYMYTYITSQILVVDPKSGGDVIYDNNKNEITLITCADSYAVKRLVVKGDFVEKKPIAQSDYQLISYIRGYKNRWK